MTTEELIEHLQRHPGLEVFLESPTEISKSTTFEVDDFGDEDGRVVVIGAAWDEDQ